MDKITEALSKLLPEDQLQEVSAAVSEMLEKKKKELEAEMNSNLEEAYATLTAEKEETERVAKEGYRQAYDIISELRNRNEIMKSEYDTAIEEGYEEAYQAILAERGKNENIEVELHEEYEKRFNESKDYMVEKLDLFLRNKGKEIYEMARRDVMNDPTMAEHKVTLDKIVESVSNYISDEDRIMATSSRLEEAHKQVEELSGRVKILESKNIRLSRENTNLNEAMKEAAALITESKSHANDDEKKARIDEAKKVTGRGDVVTEDTKVVGEYSNDNKGNTTNDDDDVVVEGFDPDTLDQLAVLAGTKKSD
ncbi:MAG: hypothetical protein DWQ19_12320 [Crenarchaeota archaeon]|nr:MAG: hypothetical protein DWQ19_12320 [Thermoproteota archaeon]